MRRTRIYSFSRRSLISARLVFCDFVCERVRACVGINSAKEQRWGRAPGVQGVKGVGKISSKKPPYLYYVYARRRSLRSHQSGGTKPRLLLVCAARKKNTDHRAACPHYTAHCAALRGRSIPADAASPWNLRLLTRK